MARKRVFLSFDYDNDSDLKGSFLTQAKLPDSPFAVTDVSLGESQDQNRWLDEAQRAISRCDLFIILLGYHTHQATGVLKEVAIASGLKKPRFQLKPKHRNPKRLPNGGEVVSWKWNNLMRCFS